MFATRARHTTTFAHRIPVGIALLVSSAAAQSFEVASVRLNLSRDERGYYSVAGQNGAKLAVQRMNLLSLIQRAYNVREYQVSGPDWLKRVKVDIKARLPADIPRTEVAAALQSLLAERFKMSVHRETRELPVYVLTVAKGGAKIKSAADPTGTARIYQIRGLYKARNESIANFSQMLSLTLDRVVTDMTGLTGTFDFVLDYAPLDPRFSDPAGARSIFTALQEQLGLKLESRKGPVELLVIDAVRKTPTEN
jgi:uncharacterized protein (TIGR03435 family)